MPPDSWLRSNTYSRWCRHMIQLMMFHHSANGRMSGDTAAFASATTCSERKLERQGTASRGRAASREAEHHGGKITMMSMNPLPSSQPMRTLKCGCIISISARMPLGPAQRAGCLKSARPA